MNSFVCLLIGVFFSFLFAMTHTVMVTILVTFPYTLKLVYSSQSVLRRGLLGHSVCAFHISILSTCAPVNLPQSFEFVLSDRQRNQDRVLAWFALRDGFCSPSVLFGHLSPSVLFGHLNLKGRLGLTWLYPGGSDTHSA